MSQKVFSTEAPPSSVLHASLSINPPKIVRAEGHYLYTTDGTKIFDASGGAAVSCLGHNNARVKRAIMDQLNKVEYTFSPHFTTDAYEQLAKFLVDSTGGAMKKVFVTGSGSEAVEACLKMARQYFMELPEPQPQRTRFIARDRSYHGNTIASLSVSGHKARRAIYEPMLLQNMSFVSPCYPYRDMRKGETDEQYVARLAQELEDEFQRVGPNTVCGVVLETMAGLTLGAVAPVPGYLKAMKAVCERHGALFVLDEVLAGMGRTGTLHAWEQEDVVPDLQTVAKGLGAGYAPIGALLVGKKVVDVLSQGTKAFMHFQTYHGHPTACAAAYEVQQVIKDEGLVENCRKMGIYLGERLRDRLGVHKNVGEIRGRGLVWAIELVQDRVTKAPFPVQTKVAPTIHAAGLQKFAIALLPGGGVVDGMNGDLVVLAPPYTITREDVDLIVEHTAKAIESILGPAETTAKL
ncbi:class III aminotransferas-like protein [Clathrospora elynae]|uniref:Class III aminotransferas-like protein n=1 Tax=Clathrospora elynae TaxID=706981 RepID=A0A6A5SNU7_9PLEO|nr:class III aminotransferas-like protein [Clathrospora elynae]